MPGSGANSDVCYYCDTTNGSSGTTCQDLGFDGGTLACNANCTFDNSGCFDSCDPKNTTCTNNADCCSGKCRGKRGKKRCR